MRMGLWVDWVTKSCTRQGPQLCKHPEGGAKNLLSSAFQVRSIQDRGLPKTLLILCLGQGTTALLWFDISNELCFG